MKNKKVSLFTYILSLLIMALVVVLIVVAIFNRKNATNENTNTIQNNASTEQKENSEKGKLEENEELKNFLSYVGDLNVYRDNNYAKEDVQETEDEFYSTEKIMIASMFTKLERKNDYVTYNLDEIKGAIKEIFNEDVDVKKATESEDFPIFYEPDVGGYIDGGGDGTYSVYVVKIEKQTYSNGVYEVTFLYGYPSEAEFTTETVGDCDCFRTTVKIKLNENYKYSKYQLVDSRPSSEKVGKIKDFKQITYDNGKTD